MKTLRLTSSVKTGGSPPLPCRIVSIRRAGGIAEEERRERKEAKREAGVKKIDEKRKRRGKGGGEKRGNRGKGRGRRKRERGGSRKEEGEK